MRRWLIRFREIFVVGFGLLALVLSGCHRAAEIDSGMEEVSEEIYPVSADVTVSITNTDGSIRVYGADTTEVKVQAIKKAYAEDRLHQIAVEIRNEGSALTIETHYPPKPTGVSVRDRSGTVDYNIVVPQGCRIAKLELTNGEVLVDGMRGAPISASLVNGRIAGKNCFADARFKVVNGGMDLFYDWWEKRAFSLEMQGENANLRASIPSDASLHFRATTDSGNISNGFADKSEQNRGGIRRADVTIGNDAEAEIEMRTTSGNIRIDEAY